MLIWSNKRKKGPLNGSSTKVSAEVWSLDLNLYLFTNSPNRLLLIIIHHANMQPAKRNHPFTNSSAPSASSRPQKSYQKNKGIEKPNRNREDLRLNKSTGALRADKKSLKHRGSQLFD